MSGKRLQQRNLRHYINRRAWNAPRDSRPVGLVRFGLISPSVPAITRAACEELQVRTRAASFDQFIRFNGLPRMLCLLYSQKYLPANDRARACDYFCRECRKESAPSCCENKSQRHDGQGHRPCALCARQHLIGNRIPGHRSTQGASWRTISLLP